MTTLTDWLTAAKARADAATKGPWVQYPTDSEVAAIEQSPQDGSIIGGGPIATTALPRDAAFIGPARTEHPTMADALLYVLDYADGLDADARRLTEYGNHEAAEWMTAAGARLRNALNERVLGLLP